MKSNAAGHMLRSAARNGVAQTWKSLTEEMRPVELRNGQPGRRGKRCIVRFLRIVYLRLPVVQRRRKRVFQSRKVSA